jgi:Bacterial Ig domain
MKIQNRFIYKLTDRLGTIVVIPLGENDFTIEYEREDEEKRSYKTNLSGKIKFIGEAYQRLMAMENSVYRCDEQVLTIYKLCNGVEKSIFIGKISLNEGEFNLDRCEITLKFLEDNSDKCYNDNKSTKLNLFQLIFDRIIVKTASFSGVIESKLCTASGAIAEESGAFYWCGSGEASDGNWIATKASASSPDGMHHNVSTTWKREIIEINCSESPEVDWVLIEDNCGTTGKKKYARTVTLINCSTFGTSPDENGAGYTYNYECEVLGYDTGLTVIDNGILFKDVIIELIKAVCPNLTLKSEFFQINPDIVTGTNYVTGKQSKVNNIVVFQKADVKRPTAINNSSKLEITLEDMLEILNIMFNVKWRIVGDVFRLEHVSYYAKGIGIDVTSSILKKYFVGRNSYSYESSKIPQKEIFKFKEQSGIDWNLEVVYSGCVSNDKKNEVTKIIDEAMTDVEFALNNPQSDSKFVDDNGFVLVSTRKIGSEYFINTESSPNGNRLNNVFAWVQLFRDYHYFERPMKSGNVNGVLTEFITTIPTKKGDRFAIPLDFCSTFNPDDFIKTGLGNGILDSGKFRLKDSMIELDLLYESNQNLVPNLPPVLDGGGVYETYMNVPKIIDISATDGDGFITGINVVYPPYLGTVEVISFSQIKYTPNVGVTGFETFSLQAVDNLSETSNIENFGVNILPENLPPVATDDEYFVWIGESWFQGESIFANDSDDFNSFTLVNDTLTTVEGISIFIDSDGFFDYTPPAGFEGNDSFQYQIEDDLGNISTATVTLKVAYRNKPIAIDDNYQTLKNTAFTADGSVKWKRKVTQNDYTPDGISYTYTTTPETKSTDNGNVVINNDGTFNYTPDTDFTGIDSFQYTVNNINGSGIGLVKISVLPMIYVKMTTNDLTQIGHAGQPIWIRRQDYILSFFSDAAGTIPFDVTGLGFQVNMKIVENIDDNGSYLTNTSFFITDVLSGTSMKILDDFTILENSTSSGYYHNVSSVVTVENGTYTKI